jgi:hypothetical protein
MEALIENGMNELAQAITILLNEAFESRIPASLKECCQARFPICLFFG